MPWKIVSWNVNGIRTINSPKLPLKKILDDFDADIICLQETKISREALEEEIALVPGYVSFFSACRTKVGYSGVATYCRSSTATPMKAEEGVTGWKISGSENNMNENDAIGFLAVVDEDMASGDLNSLDIEGRCVVTQHRLKCEDAEKTLVVFNVYVPRVDFEENPSRLDYKLNFLRVLFRRACKMISAGYHVIITGDLNVCMHPKDHCNPAPAKEFWSRLDRKLVAEYVDTGAEGISSFSVQNPTSEGIPGTDTAFVDSFRRVNPTRLKAYTVWDTQLALRIKNEGTRIDFVLVDRKLGEDHLSSGDVLQHVMGSDHCPVEAGFHEMCGLIPASSVPPFATKFYPQFGHKQQKLTAFFVKGAKLAEVKKREATGATKPTKPGGPRLISHFFAKKPKLDDQACSNGPSRTETEVAASLEVVSTESEFSVSEFMEFTETSSSPGTNSSQESSSTSNVAMKGQWKQLFKGPPKCKHGFVCVKRTVKKKGPNLKKEFWSCPIMPVEEVEKGPKCQFFQWIK